MTRIVPPLHEGHASIILQEAFLEAVEAFAAWQEGGDEPTVSYEDKDVPISSIFGRFRTSNDLLPQKARLAVDDILGGAEGLGDTYSGAASELRELSLQRLKADGQKSYRPSQQS